MTAAVFSASENTPRLGDAVAVVALAGLNREQWRAWRVKSIGGSDAAPACGISPWKGRYELWVEKTGLAPAEDVETEPMRWGHILEEPIARELEARIPGLTIFRVGEMLAHPERPWQTANVDFGALQDGETGFVEIKNVGGHLSEHWADGDVPAHVVMQVQHYLSVTGLRWAIVGALIGGNRLEVRRIERDDELIDRLVALEEQFWAHVRDGTPPAPDGTRAETEFIGRHFEPDPDSVVTLERDQVVPLVAARAEAIETERRAAMARAEAENALKVLAGDHEIAVDTEGQKLFTWKAQTRRGINTAELRRAMYDVADELETLTEVRILRVQKGVA